MYEMLAIFISVLFKYVIFWTNKNSKARFEQSMVELKPYQPPQNDEIHNLKAKKK